MKIYPYAHRKLLEKMGNILDMITNNNRQMDDWNEYLEKGHIWYTSHQIEQKIDHHKRIGARIEKYYMNTLQELINLTK